MNGIINSLVALSRTKKRILQVLVDVFLLTLLFAFAMWLRLDNLAWVSNPLIWTVMIPVMPLSIAFFIKLGFYRAVVRYIAGRALANILLGTMLSGVVMAGTAQYFSLPIPSAVPFIYMMLTFFCVGGVRFGFRELVHFSENREKERIVIYGAGAAGRQLLQLLRQGSEYLPVAFLDDSKQAQGTHVGGLPVYAPSRIESLIRTTSVNAVLLAMPSTKKARRSAILKSLEPLPLRLATIPALDDITTGKARVDQINDVSIEDLLGRDPVPPQPELLDANIRGKCVMVTGAGGSIGSELCRQILRQSPSHLVMFELSELALYSLQEELLALKSDVKISVVLGSVQSARLVENTMRTFRVQTVYHAAAYKHVSMVELNIAEGIRNNVFGTKVVAEAAIAAGVASFILVSTDKAVRPTNVMGASKRMAELVCQALASAPKNSGTVLSMVRFGNVLGSSGSVIPLFRRQIAAGGPITVTHFEVTRFFMTIPEAAQLVIQAGAMARGGDVFVLDMGDPVRIAELAAQMARLHGLKPVLVADPNKEKLGPGEIGIMFTRLRPGDKLYEELLIGNDPKATRHPRIMSDTEISQPLDQLYLALEQLLSACDRNDLRQIQQILIDCQTSYQPNSEIVDHTWENDQTAAVASDEKTGPEQRRFTLVRN